MLKRCSWGGSVFSAEDREGVNKFLSDATAQWKNLSVEVRSVRSMLEEVISNWEKYSSTVASLQAWLEDAEQMLNHSESDKRVSITYIVCILLLPSVVKWKHRCIWRILCPLVSIVPWYILGLLNLSGQNDKQLKKHWNQKSLMHHYHIYRAFHMTHWRRKARLKLLLMIPDSRTQAFCVPPNN